MSLLGLLGLVLTIVSVLAAYQVGYRAGFHQGHQEGYDDGKKAGSKEGSLRGYAVGFDRGRRSNDGTEDKSPKNESMFRIVMLIAVIGGIWILASVMMRQSPHAASRERPAAMDVWSSETTGPLP